MAMKRDRKETTQARAERDTAFRKELLREGVACLLAGDVDAGKAVLRDYINASISFEALGEFTGTSPKRLMRMLGPTGNPQAPNMFAIIDALQQREGLRLEVSAVR